MAYNNYHLYRINPKLSGNMMVDLVLEKDGDTLQPSNIHLRPVSRYIPYVVNPKENIYHKTHGFNVKEFYKQIPAYFHSLVINSELESEWPVRTDKTWDDTYWAGTERVPQSLYGKTFQTIIPLYIEQYDRLSIELHIYSDGAYVDSKVVNLGKFEGYFRDYFEHCGMLDGNSKFISIQFDTATTLISGIDCKSGNYVTREDHSLLKNLIYRERPVMETNSAITNLYRDLNLFAPQFFNLCLCYSIEDIYDGDYPHPHEDLRVEVVVKLGEEKLDKYDIYTNHHYIPQIISTVGLVDNPDNVLKYKQEHLATDLIFKETIKQGVCHWAVKGNELRLFNLSKGFGVYPGTDVDPTVTRYEDKVKNDNWTNQAWRLVDRQKENPKESITSGDLIMELLSGPNHPRFQSLTGYVGDYKFNFQGGKLEHNGAEETITDIKIAHVIGGEYSDENYNLYEDLKKVYRLNYPDDKINRVAIWTDFYELRGRQQLPIPINGSDPDTIRARMEQDIAVGADMDGRYADLTVPLHFRHSSNSHGIYIFSRVFDGTLCIVVWHQDYTKKKDDNDISVLADPINTRNYTTFGGFRKLIGLYLDRYSSALYQAKRNEDSDHMRSAKDIYNVLSMLVEAFNTFNTHKAIYFTNDITPVNDTTLSPKCEEVIYKKSQCNTYIYRYDGDIRPAIYKPVIPYGGKMEPRYGLNYIYKKSRRETMEELTNDFKLYMASNLPPRYRSVGYWSLEEPIVFNPEEHFEDPYFYKVPEYKYFDKSLIRYLPEEVILEDVIIESLDNQLEQLEKVIVKYFGMRGKEPLWPLIKGHYNVYYDLMKSTKDEQTPGDMDYIYTIKLTLK